MSIRELLDDGAVPESWKRLAVSNLRAITSTITDFIVSNDLTINNDLNVLGDVAVVGDLAVGGDSTFAQMYTPSGIRLGVNAAANNLNRYLVLQAGAFVVPGVTEPLSARYVRTGRQSTLFVYNPVGSLFTITANIAQIDITYALMGIDFQNVLEGGAGDITNRAPSTLIDYNLLNDAGVVKVLGGNTEVTLTKLDPASDLLTDYQIHNFTICWVSN